MGDIILLCYSSSVHEDEIRALWVQQKRQEDAAAATAQHSTAAEEYDSIRQMLREYGADGRALAARPCCHAMPWVDFAWACVKL